MNDKKISLKRLIMCSLPVKTCNLRCSYCYITSWREWDKKLPDMSLCVSKIKAALNPERMGGTCLINICAGGETLLSPELAYITRTMLENGHFVMIVTNGTLTNKIKEFCEFPADLRARLFLKISLHYLELKRVNKLEEFFSNIDMIKKAGISFTVELTPDDIYIPYIPEIKAACMKNLGALCHVTVPRDERKVGFPLMTQLPREEFYKIWSQFDSDLFKFKWSIFEVKRKEFCYNGEWGFLMDLCTGNYEQCYCGSHLGNLYRDTNEPLNLIPIGRHCREGHCFNGHAFLGLGMIPELETTNFDKQRNRICVDGSEWLSPEMKKIMSCKLRDSNIEYNDSQKFWLNLKSIPRNILTLGRRNLMILLRNMYHSLKNFRASRPQIPGNKSLNRTDKYKQEDSAKKNSFISQ